VSTPAVELRSVAVLREGYPVLRRLDLRVEPGEVLLLTGANGAGKTTLLRVLAGLIPVAAGQGSVLGHDLLTARDQVRRQVSLVSHESFCYDDLTVWENLLFHARLVGLRPAEAEAALHRLGLAVISERRHGRLSAGQRRRCALAVAAVRDSALVLLDEPHAALDRDGRELVDLAVADAAARGSTVIAVSHEPELIRPFSQRELVMDEGRVQELRAPAATQKK
jgi:heme ABC exporter ATP-binding subunit CcmA